jgi:hypothetical protein
MFGALFLVALAGALPAPAQEPPPAPQQTFRLEWREDGFSLGTTLFGGNREVAFEAEPAYKGKVVHGALTIGDGPTDVIGYAIDRGAHKLYLDANRNRDLTDDTGSAYSVDDMGFLMTVRHVRVTIGEGPDARSYVLELRLWGGGSGGDATLQSGWEGQVTLHDQQWLVSVIDDGNGIFDHADRMAVVSASRTRTGVIDATSYETFYLRKDIFLGGHAYTVSCEFDEGAVVATFTEGEVPMGDLVIEGEHITRLFLQGDRVAILDDPGATVMVPEGTYTAGRVFLDGAEAGWFGCDELNTRLQITPGRTATLQAGGPLNNTLQFARSGMSLNLTYALTGAGAVNYERLSGRFDKNPRFLAFMGDTKIAEANFEYG